jgi:hypothetical protein
MSRRAIVIIDISLDIIQSIVANKNEVNMSFDGLNLYVAQDDDGYLSVRWH